MANTASQPPHKKNSLGLSYEVSKFGNLQQFCDLPCTYIRKTQSNCFPNLPAKVGLHGMFCCTRLCVMPRKEKRFYWKTTYKVQSVTIFIQTLE